MALARLCLSEHLAAGCALPRSLHAAAANSHGPLNFHALFSSAAAETTTTGDGTPAKGDGHSREVTVVDRSRRRWPWRDLRDFVPFRLVDGIGSALSQGAETLTRPLERLAPSPPSSWLRPLTGKVREDEERYRLRFEVPGLGKDDVRVYVDDGVLVIHGEKRGGDVRELPRGPDPPGGRAGAGDHGGGEGRRAARHRAPLAGEEEERHRGQGAVVAAWASFFMGLNSGPSYVWAWVL